MSDDLRDRLAEALTKAMSEWETFIAGDGYRSIRGRDKRTPEDVLAEILPVVLAERETYAAQRAAEALRAAAEAAEGMHDPPAPDCAEWADWLRARALDPP